MSWASAGTVLGVLQGLVVLGLLVMQVGAWRERREHSTKALAGRLSAHASALTEVQNLLAKKVDVGRCDERFQAVGGQVDLMVTREHCDTLHRQASLDLVRIEQVASQAAQAAQTVVTTAAVISQQLKGLVETQADHTKRLGRIETALMKTSHGA